MAWAKESKRRSKRGAGDVCVGPAAHRRSRKSAAAAARADVVVKVFGNDLASKALADRIGALMRGAGHRRSARSARAGLALLNVKVDRKRLVALRHPRR